MEIQDDGVGENFMVRKPPVYFKQEELEGPHSGYIEEEETDDEEGRSEERRLKMQSSKVSTTPIKSVRSSLLFITQSCRLVCVWDGASQYKLSDFLC